MPSTEPSQIVALHQKLAGDLQQADFSSLERDAIDRAIEALVSAMVRNGADPGNPSAFAPILDLELEHLQPATTTDGDAERLVSRVDGGFASLTIGEHHKRSALDNLRRWLQTSSDTREQIEWLVHREQWSMLLDSFYRVLPFGTGGRRGPVGIGTNRFNALTLAGSVQGHVDYLRHRYPDEPLSVVVVYDVREFHDLRGIYNPQLQNPLLGKTSKDFANIAAEVYTGNGIDVHLLADDVDYFASTPELSFTIRELGASGGLNISASHNFPDDNGGKFYNRYGGQEVPPNDEDMANRVENATFLYRLPLASSRRAGLVSDISSAVHDNYVKLNVRQTLAPSSRSSRIVFTPLHGAGDSSVAATLIEAGFKVDLVPEQSVHDGRFPAVPFRAPNPEVPESMERGIELAREVDADLVMACDPDADRIGICGRTDAGDFQFFNGNEIAVLVAHYKLSQLRKLGRLPANPLVIKTEVTTELLRPITESVGGTLLGDLLVGFKYHGTILEQLEFPPPPEDPRPRPLERLGITASLADFIIGVEESHGVLVTAEVRDKDAAGAAILLAELASLLREEGRTLSDYLEDIHREHGYYANHLCSMIMTGADGLESIKKIQQSLRDEPPKRVGEWKVVEHKDHLDPNGIHGAILSETDRASRNVMVFRLDNGARIIVRPSGTEPKNKIYIEVPSSKTLGRAADRDAYLQQKNETDSLARSIADAFTKQMLALIDVSLPDYALRISGLVSLDKRIHFAETFIPEFEARAKQLNADPSLGDETQRWIDASLASYGTDARGLVADAVSEFIREQSEKGPEGTHLGTMKDAFFSSPQ